MHGSPDCGVAPSATAKIRQRHARVFCYARANVVLPDASPMALGADRRLVRSGDDLGHDLVWARPNSHCLTLSLFVHHRKERTTATRRAPNPRFASVARLTDRNAGAIAIRITAAAIRDAVRANLENGSHDSSASRARPLASRCYASCSRNTSDSESRMCAQPGSVIEPVYQCPK